MTRKVCRARLGQDSRVPIPSEARRCATCDEGPCLFDHLRVEPTKSELQDVDFTRYVASALGPTQLADALRSMSTTTLRESVTASESARGKAAYMASVLEAAADALVAPSPAPAAAPQFPPEGEVDIAVCAETIRQNFPYAKHDVSARERITDAYADLVVIFGNLARRHVEAQERIAAAIETPNW